MTESRPTSKSLEDRPDQQGAEGALFAKGALAGLLGRGTGFGMQYVFLAVVGRVLGAERAAPFYSMLAAATVLAVLGRAGLDRFGLREIAAGIARRREGIVRPLILRLMAVQVGWTIVLAAAALAARDWLAGGLSLGDADAVAWLGALALGTVLTFSLSEYVLAFRSVLAAAVVKTIIPYGVGSGVLLLVLLSSVGFRPNDIAATLLTGMAASVVVAAAIIVRKTSGAETDPSIHLPRLEIGRSVALAAVPLLMLGMTGLDVVLLQASHPGAETSFYQAAQRTAMTLTLGLLAINGIAAPLIAGAHATGRSAELARVVRRASRWSLQQAALIAVLLIVAGREVLQLFGPEFALGYGMLLILVGAQLINAACGPVIQLFVMTGNERAAFGVLLPVVMLALPGYYLAGSAMGGVGVAIVTAVAFALWNGGLVVLARWRFGIWTHADNWVQAGAFLLGAVAVAAFVTAGRLSPWGIVYATVAAAGLWAIGLTGEDRQLLLGAVIPPRHVTPVD